MKATCEVLNVPLSAPFRIATGEVRSAQNVLCTVEQDGIIGVGEATPFEVITGGTQERVLADLARLPRGFTVTEADSVEAVLSRLGAQNFCGDARQALDVALHDWFAQKRGLPLATFLGGHPRRMPTSVTIPIVDLAEVPSLVQKALDAKFRILKIKSMAGVETEAKRIRLIRELAGPHVELRVDANAGWSLAEAKQMFRVLREADVRFLEQPLKRDELAGHAELVKADQLPIMVDESVFTLADAQRVVEKRAANLFNVKLAKSGGIVEAARILKFAEARGIDCMVGCMIQTRIASSQDAHLAAGFKAVKYVDLDGHTFLNSDPIEGGVRIEQGEIHFPSTPGHGARLAQKKVAAVR
jgi:L-alanine-DL-glutamate epimerase-like enolase superfamily enzyme